MTFNHAAFEAARMKFVNDPKTLTDDDIEQFAIVLPKLADRARAKRQNLVPAESADERKKLDRPATRRDVMQSFEDVIVPMLAVGQYKRKQLEAQITTISKQLEEARSEINYLRWAREQEAAKV
jgi:hypothetical protein